MEYTGRPESEQLGYGWAEHLHAEDRERTRREWTNATVRGDKFDVEFRLRRRDGAYRWFKTRAVPLRDLGGHIIKWFGSNTDFDDHKRTEQRLETQLERMSLLDRITRAIGQRQDLSSIFEVLLRSLEESLPIDFACVCLPSESGEFLTVAAVGRRGVGRADPVGLRESARVAVDANGLSRCLRGQLVYEPNTTQVHFPFAQRLASAGLHALVLAPMSVESQVFGISIDARTEPDAFASADCEFLRQLGDQVVVWPRISRSCTAPSSRPTRTCVNRRRARCSTSGCARWGKWRAASHTTSTTPSPPWRSTRSGCWSKSQP